MYVDVYVDKFYFRIIFYVENPKAKVHAAYISSATNCHVEMAKLLLLVTKCFKHCLLVLDFLVFVYKCLIVHHVHERPPILHRS